MIQEACLHSLDFSCNLTFLVTCIIKTIKLLFVLSQHTQEASTPGILHCDEFRYFWIWWVGNKMDVGKGSVLGVETMLNYEDPNDANAVSTVSLASVDEATVTWHVYRSTGTCCPRC